MRPGATPKVCLERPRVPLGLPCSVPKALRAEPRAHKRRSRVVLSAAGPRFGASEAYFPLMLLLWSDPIRPLGKGPAAGGEAHKILLYIYIYIYSSTNQMHCQIGNFGTRLTLGRVGSAGLQSPSAGLKTPAGTTWTPGGSHGRSRTLHEASGTPPRPTFGAPGTSKTMVFLK